MHDRADGRIAAFANPAERQADQKHQQQRVPMVLHGVERCEEDIRQQYAEARL